MSGRTSNNEGHSQDAQAKDARKNSRKGAQHMDLKLATSVLEQYSGETGKFTLLKAIGRGAYGAVYLTKTAAGEKVALKHIRNAFTSQTDSRRIYREIKIMQHFDHPNLLKLKEIISPTDGSSTREIYLVTELMETDLHRVIHSKQDLTSDHIAFFLYQTLCALKHLHSANVIHRDLKPSNLLVNSDCHLKVCDFGLARESTPEVSVNYTEYVVTRWYRAPEVLLSGGKYTKTIDVWSVGCILAELLKRRPLFPGDNYLHQLQIIIETVGSPVDEDLHFVASQPAKDFIMRQPYSPGVPFEKLFPYARGPCLDLLQRMLTFDPAKRITVDEALAHPFLTRVRASAGASHLQLEVAARRKFRMQVRLKDMSADEIRDRFMAELNADKQQRMLREGGGTPLGGPVPVRERATSDAVGGAGGTGDDEVDGAGGPGGAEASDEVFAESPGGGLRTKEEARVASEDMHYTMDDSANTVALQQQLQQQLIMRQQALQCIDYQKAELTRRQQMGQRIEPSDIMAHRVAHSHYEGIEKHIAQLRDALASALAHGREVSAETHPTAVGGWAAGQGAGDEGGDDMDMDDDEMVGTTGMAGIGAVVYGADMQQQQQGHASTALISPAPRGARGAYVAAQVPAQAAEGDWELEDAMTVDDDLGFVSPAVQQGSYAFPAATNTSAPKKAPPAMPTGATGGSTARSTLRSRDSSDGFIDMTKSRRRASGTITASAASASGVDGTLGIRSPKPEIIQRASAAIDDFDDDGMEAEAEAAAASHAQFTLQKQRAAADDDFGYGAPRPAHTPSTSRTGGGVFGLASPVGDMDPTGHGMDDSGSESDHSDLDSYEDAMGIEQVR